MSEYNKERERVRQFNSTMDTTPRYNGQRQSEIDILQINREHATRELDRFYADAISGAKRLQKENASAMQYDRYRTLTEDADRYYKSESMHIQNMRRQLNDLSRDNERYYEKKNEIGKRIYNRELEYQHRVSQQINTDNSRLRNTTARIAQEVNTKLNILEELRAKGLGISLKMSGLDENSDNYKALSKELHDNIEATTKLEREISDLDSTMERSSRRFEAITRSLKDFATSSTKGLTSHLLLGISKYQNAYERTFTNIAGRIQQGYAGTRGLYQGAITAVNSSNLKSAINISDDMIPALAHAVQQGFTGQGAISKALSDSAAKVVMPWLDTSNEAWLNMSFNMSKYSLDMLKAQQLQLQTTQAGNRLLQSGVVNSLVSEVEPLLRGIDYNTSDKKNLPKEYQAIMAGLVGEGRMSEREAYSYITRLMKVQSNQYGALTGGNLSDKLMAMDFARGLSPMQVVRGSSSKLFEMARNAPNDLIASAMFEIFGLQGSAYTREIADSYIRGIQSSGKYMSADGTGMYEKAVSRSGEYVTASQGLYNWQENTTAQAIGSWITAIPGHEQWFSSVTGLLGDIYRAILGGGGANFAGNLLGGAGGLGRKLLPALGKGIAKFGLPALGVGAALYGGYDVIRGIGSAFNNRNTTGQKISGAVSGIVGGLGSLALGAGILTGHPAVAAIGALAVAGKHIYNEFTKTSGIVNSLGEAFKAYRDLLNESNTALAAQIGHLNELNNAEEKKKYLVQNNLAGADILNASGSKVDSKIKYLDSMNKLITDAQKASLDSMEAITKEKAEKRRVVSEQAIYNDILSTSDINIQRDKLRMLGFGEADVNRVGTGRFSAKNLLDRKQGWLGWLGIGNTHLRNIKDSAVYDGYIGRYNINTDYVSTDMNIINDIAKAAGFMKHTRNTDVPAFKKQYDEYKQYLSLNYDKFRQEIDLALGAPLASYAKGSEFIRHDQIARLHQGERVLTKQQNEKFTAIANTVTNPAAFVGTLLNTLYGYAMPKTSDENDITRDTMTKKIVDGLNSVVNAISGIQLDSDQINYNTRLLPKTRGGYNENLINLAPSVLAAK